MKDRYFRSLFLAASLTVLPAIADTESPAGGYFDLGKFTPPSDGGEFIEVQINSNLINIAARLTEKSEPDVAKLLRGLHSVRVNVIGLDEDNADEMSKRVRNLRAKLEKAGWERVVTVQQKNEDVGVYIKLRGEEAVEGVVVTVIEGKQQAVLVNVVGDIRPEQIAMVGERLHIAPLKHLGETIR